MGYDPIGMELDPPFINVKYDVSSDVLYVKKTHSIISKSKPMMDDDFVILNYDKDNNVVGLQFLEIEYLSVETWRNYFQTAEIPADIFKAVDNWLIDRQQ